MRRLPAPWTVEKTPGGFKIIDANGQTLAYVYSRAGVLTEDEASSWFGGVVITSPAYLIALTVTLAAIGVEICNRSALLRS